MKRKIAIAVAVAALVGGGAATAVAASGDDSAPTAKISAKDAASAALEQKPGSVESVDRDDDGAWEVEIVDAQGRDHEVRVDAQSGKATLSQDDDADDRDDRDDRDDDRDDRDDRAEKAVTEAKVNAEKASAAALELRPGTATEVEFDDGHWDVEVRSADGREHDVRVDSETGKATLSQDDDQNDDNDANDNDRDDRDDRDDDRNDDGTNDQDDRDDDKSDD
ncbi:PepSY domain-containing protein [Streptomyces jumonjinensis]|uniref:PepSY domain-containing protein n=1 Tax=Streptomyces jumonjinensis TaxID=1945 RepID=A0A646KCB5_STRJU|nr:PepSY domain-containing protein [Streptomyces jumonjinensis]MQS99740.1 PepSY domain-containing protein [Streptomyces jumonjinensis]